MNREIRLSQRPFEVRSLETGETVIEGYAAVFNSLSEDLGGFFERVLPQAIQQSALQDVRALVEHDPARILGRSTAGTLALQIDGVGLRFALTLPNTTTGRDIAESIKRGDVNACSFGFYVAKDEFVNENGIRIRNILQISRIDDVSVVTFPAYPDTSVALRSLEKVKQAEIHNRIRNKVRIMQLMSA